MTRSRRRKLLHTQSRQRVMKAVKHASLVSLVLAPIPAAIAAAVDDDANIAEIVVTAQKREERLQDVPISIQALGTETLSQHEVTSFDDYVKLLPSVSFQSYGPSQSQVFFRGISSAGDGGYGVHAGSQPASGVYIDEIPVTTIGNTVDFHVYDIARVEALSGPQGTLYGASSLAGTMRIITNQPDPTHFSAGYEVQGDKFSRGNGGGVVEGFLNVPIAEHAAIRLVGFYEHDGGYIDNVPSSRTYTLGDTDPSNDIHVNNSRFVKNDYNDVDTYGGRVAVKVDVTDHWTVTPSIIYQHQVANGNFLYDPQEGYLKVNDYTPEQNTDSWYQSALTVQGKIGNWDVVYAGGYFGRTIETEADYSYYTVAYDQFAGATSFPNGHGGFLDPTQQFVGSDKYTKQTHEVRVSSPQDKRLRVLGGFFFQRQSDEIHASFAIPGLASIPDSPAVPKFGDSIFATDNLAINRDYAEFGEIAFDILHNLTLTGGIRGFKYDNTVFGFSGFASNAAKVTCLPTTRPDLPCVNRDTRTEGTGETHKINLSYKFDSDRMIYATYSTGFRPGGTNRAGVNPYAPDSLTNYEVGWKTAWFDRKLYLNGAAFVENWDRVQYGLSPVGSAGVINIYNAGNAKVKGVEADALYHATKHLTLSASGSYIDAKLTTSFCSFDAAGNPDCVNGTIAAPVGTALPIQPHFKINSTARYDFNVGPLDSFVQAAMFHQTSSRSWLTDNEANLLGNTPGFTTYDFSAGFAHNDMKYEVFLQNAFDSHGELSINTVCVPTICGFRPRIYPAKPQEFGFKISQKF
jgi:iron complex outermembrane recepter protein